MLVVREPGLGSVGLPWGRIAGGWSRLVAGGWSLLVAGCWVLLRWRRIDWVVELRVDPLMRGWLIRIWNLNLLRLDIRLRDR